MLLEYAEASFECMEHRFRQLRGLACVKRVLQEYALANDVGLQFGDVPIGLVKMLMFPGRRVPAQFYWPGPGPAQLRDSLICADNRQSSDLDQRQNASENHQTAL